MTRMRSILLIDDDQELGLLLRRFLEPYGIDCLCAHNARAGLRSLRESSPELVILDIMLPDLGGLELCRNIRGNSSVPIIMLSARGDVNDRILGLEMGADDYLPKPFEPRELLARIESVLRRLKPGNGPLIDAGELRIDVEAQEAWLGGGKLDLSPLEFRCLVYLAQNRRRVLTRDLLLAELRGLDWALDNRSVDILISRLRRKLADEPANPRFVATVRGSGYRFIA